MHVCPNVRVGDPPGAIAGPFLAIILMWCVVASPLRAADPPARPKTAPTSSASDAPSSAAFLERAWPDHPEWLAMLADIIVRGDRISGSDGWFRRGVSQTRFGWMSTRAALDRDGNDTITRAEFTGSNAEFGRLDRNADAVLTAADFDFTTPPGPAPASLFFSRADVDGDGKVTRAELGTLFTKTDRGGLGFLSLADLQQAFAQATAGLRGSPGAPGGPTRWTFLKSFLRQELGPFPAGPRLNETAPDFTLKQVKSLEEVTLSRIIGPKPVVLVFGNYTCRPFRGEAGDLEKLYQRYKNKATFLMIYVREAHPTDGWRMEANDRLGVAVRQPRTYEERDGVAQSCLKTMGIGFPMVVDTVDDSVNNLYSGVPSRLYLIDRAGKIAFKSGRGPFGFKPAELEHSLVLLLHEEENAAHAELKIKPAQKLTSRRPQDGSR